MYDGSSLRIGLCVMVVLLVELLTTVGALTTDVLAFDVCVLSI